METLEKRLKELENKIKEAKLQLPAHSTKPSVMMPLLDLEDERDDLMIKINSIKGTEKIIR